MRDRTVRGEDLRSLREQAGLFRRDLAEQTGLKPNYIRNIENWGDQPSDVVAHRIALVLSSRLGRSVSVEEFSDKNDEHNGAAA